MAKEKIITTNDLAVMIDNLAVAAKHGFDDMSRRMATKDDLNALKDVVKDIAEELNATHQDVRIMRSTVDMLVRG